MNIVKFFISFILIASCTESKFVGSKEVSDSQSFNLNSDVQKNQGEYSYIDVITGNTFKFKDSDRTFTATCSTNKHLSDSWQLVFAGQEYSTFYSIYMKHKKRKDSKHKDTLIFELKTYKGPLNIGLVDVIQNNKNPNQFIFVIQALEEDTRFILKLKEQLVYDPNKNIRTLDFYRFIKPFGTLKTKDSDQVNGLDNGVFDSEYFVRNGFKEKYSSAKIRTDVEDPNEIIISHYDGLKDHLRIKIAKEHKIAELEMNILAAGFRCFHSNVVLLDE